MVLNLAYITCGLAPFDVGGPATVANALIRQFSKMNPLKVNLIALTSGSKNEVEALFDNKLESVTRLSLDQPTSYYIRKMSEVWKALDGCQLVHINDLYIIRNFYFPIFAFLQGKSIVYSYHGWISNEIKDYFVGERFRSIKTEIEERFFNFAKRFWSMVVVNSEHSKKLAIECEGFGKEKIRLIPHGFDREGIDKAQKLVLDGNVKLLYIGVLKRGKRVDLILKAIFLLDPAIRRKIRLYVAGGGPSEEEYKELAARLNIQKHIKFLGPLPLNECYRLYKSCDIYVHASTMAESFGMSLLEALGSGMPVIAVSSGATRELIKDGRNGFLVNANPYEIAKKIALLIQRTDMCRQISRNNRVDVRKYSWPRIAFRYLELYQSFA